MTVKEQVGRRIKVRRVELGLTQGQLAHKLSVGQSNLSYIEKGKRDIGVTLLAEIAQALECRPEEFFKELYAADRRIAADARVTGGAGAPVVRSSTQ